MKKFIVVLFTLLGITSTLYAQTTINTDQIRDGAVTNAKVATGISYTKIDFTGIAAGTIPGTEAPLTFNSPLNRVTNTISLGIVPESLGGTGLSSVPTGYVVFGGASTLTYDSAFKWDATNHRLGIGVTPLTALHVNGTTTTTGLATTTLKTTSGTPGLNKILTDADGQGTTAWSDTPGLAGATFGGPIITQGSLTASNGQSVQAHYNVTAAGPVSTGEADPIMLQTYWNPAGSGTVHWGIFGLTNAMQIPATNTASTDYQLVATQSRAETLGSGTIASIVSVDGVVRGAGSGILTEAVGGYFNISANGDAVTNAYGTQGIVYAIGSAVGTAYGHVAQQHGAFSGGTIDNAVGLASDEQNGGGTSNVNLLLGTLTPPTGNYNIYASSAYLSKLSNAPSMSIWTLLDTDFGPYVDSVYAFTPAGASASGSAVYGEGQLATSAFDYPTAYGGVFRAGDASGATHGAYPTLQGVIGYGVQQATATTHGGVGGSTGMGVVLGGHADSVTGITGLSVTSGAAVSSDFAYGVFGGVSSVSTATVTNAFNFYGRNGNTGGAGVITNMAGFTQPDLTVATNNTNLLMGTDTIPAGNWNVYSSSAYKSKIAVTADVVPLTIDTAGGHTADLLDLKLNTADRFKVAASGAFTSAAYTATRLPLISTAGLFLDDSGATWSGTGATMAFTIGGITLGGSSASGTGLYLSGANTLGLVTNGTERWVVNSSGGLVPTLDNNYDIGNGTNNPRDIEASRNFIVKNGILTVGDLTATNTSLIKTVVSQYDWTNAMVTGLGAFLTGDLTVATLPAKTVVKNAYLVVKTAAGGTDVTTLTASLGYTAANYVDYIIASDLKASANTVYGDASGERGTALTGYDLPSFTGTTAVKLHFILTTGGAATLADVTTCTGTVYIETEILP